MPHSSGGGSHGGGSHGGSHHSSHSHGGSGRSSRHVRSTYFPDARRYVYYDHHRPVYVYADYDITEKRSPLRFLMLLFYLPFILFTFSMFAEAYHHPHKLPQNYDYKIVVEDKANVLGNTAELRNSLVAFYNRTGISPAVITVENSDPDPDFNDWYWEGMQGDDTDNIITVDVADDFKDLMQKYLTANSRYDVSSAIAAAFDETTPNVMDGHVEWLFVIWGLLGREIIQILKTMPMICM